MGQRWVVYGKATLGGSGGLYATGSVEPPWDTYDAQQKIARLIAMVAEHETHLASHDKAIWTERRERERAIRLEREAREALGATTRTNVREAMAGELRLETFAIGAFFFGSLLATWGSLSK